MGSQRFRTWTLIVVANVLDQRPCGPSSQRPGCRPAPLICSGLSPCVRRALPRPLRCSLPPSPPAPFPTRSSPCSVASGCRFVCELLATFLLWGFHCPSPCVAVLFLLSLCPARPARVYFSLSRFPARLSLLSTRLLSLSPCPHPSFILLTPASLTYPFRTLFPLLSLRT